ncbi:MAG: hypothetical protein ACR2RD_03920 [Woeseiaceae bacterium]
MLRSVHAVTYTAPNFDASCVALESAFGYHRVDEGRITEELAAFWGAAATAGSRTAIFRPSSAEAIYIRLIEQIRSDNYQPLRTFGWNAAELHVRDVNALAAELDESAFRVLGGPRDLLEDGTAVALQVMGPSEEVFYLTEINGAAMQQSYGKAASPVGRTFIVVLGCSNVAESLEFYSHLCEDTTEPHEFPIRVLASAHSLDPIATRFPIASAILQEQFRIELDGYPDTAIPRPVDDACLPPGLCMVSFLVDSHDELPLAPLRAMSGIDSLLYRDRPTALIQGPDGELLELIASPS